MQVERVVAIQLVANGWV